ncbi:MAG: 16S rRNA (cytidine(1402)-2'-O)-methyltransferase [Acidobacteriota bacterium]
MPGTLYLVATPIGNLQDMSFRAIDVLRSVDIIACEDTRHSRKLLTHFSITNKLVSYHEHNEEARSSELAARLAAGGSVAVISDAGTPGICDPGSRMVLRAIEVGADVVSIPGPVAFAAAVVASGLPTDAIFFGGFLPPRTGERQKRLNELKGIPATLVFYEAPHRLNRMLADSRDTLGDRQAAVVRELTKLHEEIVRGTLVTLAELYTSEAVKGEIVVVISRASTEFTAAPLTTLSDRVTGLEAEGLDHKAALKKAAKEFGLNRSAAYRQLITEKK